MPHAVKLGPMSTWLKNWQRWRRLSVGDPSQTFCMEIDLHFLVVAHDKRRPARVESVSLRWDLKKRSRSAYQINLISAQLLIGCTTRVARDHIGGRTLWRCSTHAVSPIVHALCPRSQEFRTVVCLPVHSILSQTASEKILAFPQAL